MLFPPNPVKLKPMNSNVFRESVVVDAISLYFTGQKVIWALYPLRNLLTNSRSITKSWMYSQDPVPCSRTPVDRRIQRHEGEIPKLRAVGFLTLSFL
jgi:hypothetical protein